MTDIWYLARGGKIDGPISDQRITELIRRGDVNSNFLVWKKGLHTWEPLALHFQADNSPAIAIDYDSTRRRNHAPGSLSPILLFFLFTLVVLAIVYAFTGTTFLRVYAARKAFAQYKVEVDAANRTLSITGTIGPGLLKRIENTLNTHSVLSNISIESPGGLQDEAMAIARFIESRDQITVIARKTCDSACIIVLLSARNRLAEWDMKLGFHSSQPIIPLDGLQELHELFAEEHYTYLIKRGVPAALVARIKGRNSSEMEYVSATELMKSGVLTGLVDGQAPVEISVARWRQVENALAAAGHGEAASVFAAIRSSDESNVRRYGPELVKALENEDPKMLHATASRMVDEVTRRSILAADGDLLLKYAASQRAQIRNLATLKQWDTCSDYVNDRLKSKAKLDRDLLRSEWAALARLIKSGAANKWKSKIPPSWLGNQTKVLFRPVVLEAVRRGLLDSNGDTVSVKADCLYSLMLTEAILDTDPFVGAAVYRAILMEGA